jgi:hypothetical protein
MLFQKGAIGFSRKKRNWVSRIIAWFTRSQWSHTFIIYQDSPEILVVEAGMRQVQLVPISKYESSKYDVAYFAPDLVHMFKIEAGISKVKGKIEAPYGMLQFVGFVPVIILRRLLGMKIPNPLRGGIVCSELVLQYLREIDPQGKWGGMDKNAVSPEDLFSALAMDNRFRPMAQER